MAGDLFSDLASVVLERVLDGTALRHRALADNVANVDTPGFQRKAVEFREQLRAILEASPSPEAAIARLQRLQPRSLADRSSPPRQDGNNVDIDLEMAALAKNTLEYESAAELLAAKLRQLRAVIS
jgi:flagellar basal-body rod protein FlgB